MKNIEMAIQQQTQQDIQGLKNQMSFLYDAISSIDSNMRQSHMGLLQEMTKLEIRVKFLIKKLYDTITDKEAIDAEFKAFAEEQTKMMETAISEAVKKAAEEKKKAAEGAN